MLNCPQAMTPVQVEYLVTRRASIELPPPVIAVINDLLVVGSMKGDSSVVLNAKDVYDHVTKGNLFLTAFTAVDFFELYAEGTAGYYAKNGWEVKLNSNGWEIMTVAKEAAPVITTVKVRSHLSAVRPIN